MKQNYVINYISYRYHEQTQAEWWNSAFDWKTKGSLFQTHLQHAPNKISGATLGISLGIEVLQ